MSPPPSRSVSPIYDARQAHRDMQDTWSESSADTQWSSTFPTPAIHAHARPDGHPVRDGSLRHLDNSPAGQVAGRLHRATATPSVNHAHPAIAVPAAVPRPDAKSRRVIDSSWGAVCEASNPERIPFADAAASSTVMERIDGFAMALPFSAADKAVDSGIAAARRLGRAVSRRIDRKETPQPVLEPVIGAPENAKFENEPAFTTVPLTQVATDPAAAARRHQIWLGTLSPLRPARSPPASPSAPARPATAVSAAFPRDGNSQYSRYNEPTEMTSSRSKAVPTVATNKPLPAVPHRPTPDTPNVQRYPAEASYPSPANSNPPKSRASAANKSIDIDALAEQAIRQQAARQNLDGRFHTNDGPGPGPAPSDSSSEDAAAAVWREMELESGIRMRG